MEFLASRVKNFGVNLAKSLIWNAKLAVPVGCGVALYLHYEKTSGGITRVSGPSMLPTLNHYHFEAGKDRSSCLPDPGNLHPAEDFIIYNRQFELSRGDVVMLKEPKKGGIIVKRVLGLPGDSITPLTFGLEEGEPLTLGEDQVWVESDHKGFGYRDSSLFGPVSRNNIEAKVTYAFHPNWEWLWFNGRTIESLIPEGVKGRIKVGKKEEIVTVV